MNQSIRPELRLWSLSAIFSDYVLLQIELFNMQSSYEEHVKTQVEKDASLAPQRITSIC